MICGSFLTQAEAVAAIRSKVAEVGGQKAIAGLAKVSPSYVCEILRGSRKPGRKILGVVGLERLELYAAVTAKKR